MLVRLGSRCLFFPKTKTLVTSLHFLRFLCSSELQHLQPVDPRPSLPQLEPSNDADLISQVLLQHHNPFHAMESSLQLHGISLTPFLVHQTLLRLKHSSKIALSFFQYSQFHPSYSLDSTTFNLLIDILCKVHQFDVAWQLIIQMDQKCIKPNFTTFYLLIRRLISAGLTRQAIRAFSEMHIFMDEESEEQVWKSYFCYLLDTLCKYGYVKVATEVFNKEKWRLELNCKIYTILIYGWCKVKNIDMARRFLGEMLEKGIDPNVVSYNVLLNGICRRASLHPEGRFEKVIREAEKLFDDMTERGVEPDVTSYSVLLHVYSRAHKPELLLDKLRIMRRKGICPNIVTYSSVIKCLCSCGRIEDAELLLELMVSNGVTPTSATYNCFFKEYKGRKDVDGALRLYEKMRQGSLCPPNVSTYNILLGMLLKLGRIGLARDIWEDMKASGAGPDLDSYTLLVHGFCEKQKWKTACEFFMEMIEKGYLPHKVTFETLYRGLIQSNMLRTWRRLKKRLDEESITFGSEFENYHLKPYRR
ncbi:PREDICTED: pentatricopeptide repeat-containing protein At2g13420, mitochondrial-like [Nicotiana attenuata]|uniref:Pentatricopeptide repeat-containing protein, mitochondrial n=1 Tax=Nicotiana attenuata TaxID=49451 RepID=A0A1J6IFX1_NICAT|nr:PREDICTED: pentatricopeptide repeat-containing protein At2g13420, mitochondrial-like [Nicotiana attenuata]OIT03284.1 pentatricopeptide repeat-containing protein, mitochondrial [Nicotiana attenuata]